VSLMPFWLMKLIRVGPFGKIIRLEQEIINFREHMTKICEERKIQFKKEIKEGKQVESRDLLSCLLKAQENVDASEEKLTDGEIASQYILFFGAGTENTAHLIAMCVYSFIQYPEYRLRVIEEIKKNIADIDKMSYEEISKCEMLNAFVKETLRLYIPLQFTLPRIASSDNYLDNVKVKSGTVVQGYLPANSYNENYFPDVEMFKPERWIEEKIKGVKEPFAFIPFWSGPRNCMGMHLAYLEVKIFLIRLLKRYEFSLMEGYKLKMTNKFLYEPMSPIMVKFDRIRD